MELQSKVEESAKCKWKWDCILVAIRKSFSLAGADFQDFSPTF